MKSNRKIAIVVSSFCGYLKEELEKNQDIFITPLQIFIDDQQWFEGYYGEKEKYEFIEKFRNSNNFRTSLAPTSMIEEQMNKLSKDYDDVIYLPIHSSLSSSHDSILNLSKKYKNIHVFDNKLVGESFLIVAKEIKKRYEEESNSIEDIFKFLTWFNDRI
ncbi:MAG: DegV family protein, partial [Mycoplasmataceae bacterium]|nr:DegV family protein [Mycoplasmataceae bacterium]